MGGGVFTVDEDEIQSELCELQRGVFTDKQHIAGVHSLQICVFAKVEPL